MLEELSSLDTKIRLSILPDDELSQASDRFSISSEVGLYLIGDNAEVNLFFKSSNDMPRDLRLFLQRFDAIEKNGTWRIRRKIVKSFRFLAMIRELLALNSTVLSAFWIDHGIYRIEISFNHVESEKVSEIILLRLPESDNAALEYFGPSGGFLSVLAETQQRTFLSVIEIRTDSPPPVELMPENNPIGDSWTRLVKLPYGSATIDGVYITKKLLAPNSRVRETIPGSLYYASSTNPFIGYISNEINSARILTVGSIQRLIGNQFTIWYILPSIFVQELLFILSGSRSKYGDWKPYLQSIFDFSTFEKIVR
ncbi:MAG: hypothetical protein M1306_00725 [Candidatus Thermoplasmatota archaeon]|jgi:hypothetical protein|nr:hypothetical protein [Candidatus Thermoplasmatota archaeon]